MDLTKMRSFCAFNIKGDALVRALNKCSENDASAVENYSEIVNILLVKGQTLGEYFHELLLYSDSPLVGECAKYPTDLRIKAIEYDLGVVREVVSVNAERLKLEIAENTGNKAIFVMPDYENGSFDYDAEYFLDNIRKNGSGIFAKYRAFTFNGKLKPIENPDPISLGDLKNYEVQRRQVVENTLCFLNDKPAQNVLLYGDRGAGKSSTVKAVFNEYKALRMVEIAKEDIRLLPELFEILGKTGLKFIVMIDDLSFAEADDRFAALKAALDGSLSAKPENILIYATTNRRKIIRETVAEREIGAADAIDESMSLSDRFGLFITFSKPDKLLYLDIVHKLCADKGINVEQTRVDEAAERFATRHSGRSPRTARQFVEWLYSRIELNLEY
ncbi:MAG: ATP-binding protein [Oscillospiraceae bacterium]|nr:ATP-binding protein [Oscillospiraceae bacterium]